MSAPPAAPEALKACCAAVYESDWARWLLGESLHPGGLALTERLGALLELGPGQRVLDVAAGKGASAIFLAERFGCEVVGLEYGLQAVAEARAAAESAGVAGRVQFRGGDAEALPFASGEFDAVICECAFCTFPDKRAAAAEFARVVRSPDPGLGRAGGRVGLSDLTRRGPLPPELESLLAWIACLADAQPAREYVAYLQGAGMDVERVEAHDEALIDMVAGIQARLLGAELLVKVKKIDLPGADFEQARRLARAAAETARQGGLGYALITAVKHVPG